MSLKPDFGNVRQLGYVVEELEPAVNIWSANLGVGPWTIIKNVPLQCTYMGEPSQSVIDYKKFT